MASLDPRKLPKRTNSKETVGGVLDAVGPGAVGDGVEGLRVARVAKVAGVSVGSVYQYFPTKDSLLTAWEQRVSTRALERFNALIGELGLSPTIRIVRGQPAREARPHRRA